MTTKEKVASNAKDIIRKCHNLLQGAVNQETSKQTTIIVRYFGLANCLMYEKYAD